MTVRPETLTVPADPDRLHQLLANLLDNAVRHSPDGGLVQVSAEAAGSDVLVAVADEGPGIAASDRRAVFERFTTSAAHNSGTGLGLAISRWVAQLHGGSIAVADSEHGCRIHVLLPDGRRPSDHHEGARHEHPHPTRPAARRARRRRRVTRSRRGGRTRRVAAPASSRPPW